MCLGRILGDSLRALLEAGIEPELPVAGPGGFDPEKLLSAAIGKLTAAGLLPPARQPVAELLAWSAVHGLAMLVIAGPLKMAAGPRVHQVGQRLLDMVEKVL